MNETIVNELLKLASDILPLLISLVSALLLYVLLLIKKRIQVETVKITDEGQRKLLENAIDDAFNLANQTVAAIEQQAASAIREAVKDGKVDRNELLKLSDQALTEIKAKLSPEAQRLISENFADLDAYLKNEIEAAVLQIKGK